MVPSAVVGVALVNWNSGSLTTECIQSLLEGDTRPRVIVVYDNASTDGSADEIAREFPGVVLVRGDRNIGYTGANNAAVSLLLDRRVDYVWILNNDTVVDPRCLTRLLDAMETDPGIAACSAKIVSDQEPARLWYAGAYLNPLTLEMPRHGEKCLDTGQYDQPEDVSFLTGCCMFVRRGVLESAGLFDDTYFAYCEDEDWCLRVVRAGMRLRYAPEAVIRHRISASISRNAPASGGSTSPYARYLTARNRAKLIRRHAPNAAVRCCALTAHLAKSMGVIAGTCLLGRWRKAQAVAQGLRDGLFGDPNAGPAVMP